MCVCVCCVSLFTATRSSPPPHISGLVAQLNDDGDNNLSSEESVLTRMQHYSSGGRRKRDLKQSEEEEEALIRSLDDIIDCKNVVDVDSGSTDRKDQAREGGEGSWSSSSTKKVSSVVQITSTNK